MESDHLSDTNELKAVFESLFREYADVIYRFCLYKTSDKNVAHDLTQDTFLRLWKAMNSGSTVEKPKQYIYQIARNLVVDYYKKVKAVSLDALEQEGFEARETSPGSELMSELLLLRDAIEKLERDYREVLYMRFIEDMNVEDIAETLGVSPNLVSVRINRGKKKLHELFI